MKYKLKEDFVIPAGTVLQSGPAARTFGGDHYEAHIGLSNDDTAIFGVWIEGVVHDMVEEIEEGS